MKIALPLMLFATAVQSATINADSTDRDDVQAAIDAAVSGDIVEVPAGTNDMSNPWTNSITIPAGKNIWLRGSGTNTTRITCTASRWLKISAGARVTGWWVYNTNNLTSVDIIRVESPNTERTRIDNCFLSSNPVGSAKKLLFARGNSSIGQPYVVVDNCTLIDVRCLMYGNASLMAWNIWSTPLDLGGDTAFYCESNTIRITVFGNVIDGNYGARYVFRYNTVYNGSVEMHGRQSTGSRGGMKWEVYGNNFIQDSGSPFDWMLLRGGTGVVFSNSATGTWGSSNPRVDVRAAIEGLGYGGADYDGNDAIASQGTGTHDGANGATALTDSSKSWTSLTNDRTVPTGENPAYWVWNTTTGARGIILSNTTTTVYATLSGGTRQDWNSSDAYKITGGYWSRDGIGRGADPYLGSTSDWPPQPLEPAYFWGNAMNGSETSVTISGGVGFWCETDRDLYVNSGAKPGYTNMGALSSLSDWEWLYDSGIPPPPPDETRRTIHARKFRARTIHP